MSAFPQIVSPQCGVEKSSGNDCRAAQGFHGQILHYRFFNLADAGMQPRGLLSFSRITLVSLLLGMQGSCFLRMLLTPDPTTDFRKRGSGGHNEVWVWPAGLGWCCFRRSRRLSSSDGSPAFAEAQLQLCWQPADVGIIFRENWQVRMTP